MEKLLQNICIYLVSLLILSGLKFHAISMNLETENFYSKISKTPEKLIEPTLSPTPVSLSIDGIRDKVKVVNYNKAAQVPKLKDMKILIVGDSMMQGSVGVQLEKILSGYGVAGVYRYGKPSTGMARPDFFNWDKKLTEILKVYSPDIAIVMFGANDGQSIWHDKKWVKINDPLWEDTYKLKVEQFSTKLYENKAKYIYWVGNPICRYDYYSAYMKKINNALAKYSTERSDFVFVPTWDRFVDSEGKYTNSMTLSDGSKKIIRSQDGIHFTNDGAKMVVDEVIEKIKINIRF